MKARLIFHVLLTIPLFSLSQIDYKGFPQWSWHQQDSTEYYLYTPSHMEAGRKYPVALFLHGCCGEDDHASLRNTVDPPARIWHNFGANTQTIPTYIIAPATSRGWERHFENIRKVIDSLITRQQADPQRIYISGFSMGGDGTFKFISKYPDYFAAAIMMGMEMKGDLEKIKDIPLWANRGETDWYARNLPKQVASIRTLNGSVADTGFTWITGINPRFSDFKGVGHGVQWLAASTQDLTGWAYSKVNDGNLYPHVGFIQPGYKKIVKKNSLVKAEIYADDPDGTINKVEVFVNRRLQRTFYRPPFTFNFIAPDGDILLEAKAYDSKGKMSAAANMIKTNIPAAITTTALPFARKGAWYHKQVYATGNGPMRYIPAEGSSLPEGIVLTSGGELKGIPTTTGEYKFAIAAVDEDRDTATMNYTFSVKQKRAGDVTILKAVNDSGIIFPTAKVRNGETPFFGRDDNEINFSNTSAYDGLSFIKGNSADTSRNNSNYLELETDEDAMVYIAYETLNNKYRSTTPSWLKNFTRQTSQQIVAQYFYYDVYAASYNKGKIMLPGADEKRNGVNTNYFVMVTPVARVDTSPEINTTMISKAKTNTLYQEQVTALYGKGIIQWKVVNGNLPKGISLKENGMLSGIAHTKGVFRFTVEARDEQQVFSRQALILEVQ